jgi:hypothetical protein
MSAIKKQEVMSEFDDLIETMSKKEQFEFVRKLRKIKENVEKLLEQAEDEAFYKHVVNKSMLEVWDNDKDAMSYKKGDISRRTFSKRHNELISPRCAFLRAKLPIVPFKNRPRGSRERK